MAVIFNVAGQLPKIKRPKKKIGAVKPRVKVVEVSARRWFQKSYGNTYHKVKV